MGLIRINISFKNWPWAFLKERGLAFITLLYPKINKNRALNIWMAEMSSLLLDNKILIT